MGHRLGSARILGLKVLCEDGEGNGVESWSISLSSDLSCDCPCKSMCFVYVVLSVRMAVVGQQDRDN
jgi:hypothetical protein